MDAIGLITLEAEVRDDVRVAREAARSARSRFEEADASGRESCAFQLLRLFNIVEQMGLRIARSFENHLDQDKGWHAELIHRLGIAFPGVRPALYPDHLVRSLRELRGFWHVISHAYDLEIDGERLGRVLDHAQTFCESLPETIDVFFSRVREQEGVEPPRNGGNP